MIETTELYCDGGCIRANPSEIGGTYAGCLVNTHIGRIRQWAGFIPPDAEVGAITNNYAEMKAILEGLKRLPDDWVGTVYSDSMVTLGRVQDATWKTKGLPSLMVADLRGERDRFRNWKNITFVLLDGHPTVAQLAAGRGKRNQPVSIHNRWCDTACGRVALSVVKGTFRENYERIREGDRADKVA